MITQIIWEGVEYHSLEYATLVINRKGFSVTSSIVGVYQGKRYRLDYFINGTTQWEVRHAEINSFINNKEKNFVVSCDGNGKWTSNGKVMRKFSGCTEVDISLTPFTNSLPINRLKLRKKESQVIDVVLFDVLENSIKRAKQQYTKLSAASYKFQNVPNDFEAILRTDSKGLVKNYPGLFRVIDK